MVAHLFLHKDHLTHHPGHYYTHTANIPPISNRETSTCPVVMRYNVTGLSSQRTIPSIVVARNPNQIQNPVVIPAVNVVASV